MAVFAFKFFDFIPVRFNLWVMMFTSCWVSYMLRVNMSINIIAMVPKVTKNNVTTTGTDQGMLQSLLSNSTTDNVTLTHVDITDLRAVPQGSSNKFNWTEPEQALILSAYFWSYIISSALGGTAAERYGPRYVVLITAVSSAIFTALCPIAAKISYMALIVLRFLLGFAGGFVYPALHALIARWVPPAEKGKFISSLMGGTLGTVLTWSLTGPLMEKYDWEVAFYVPAAIVLGWCFIWWYLVADTPAEHPRISEKEKKYILDALGDKVTKSKRVPPFKSMATSIPFMAMVILHCGNLWGLYFVMTAAPKFMANVLGFDLSSAGALSSLPYLARLICATIFGSIGDFILSRKLMTSTMIRKFFCLFSHIMPGLFLVILVYGGRTAYVSVALMTTSMGFNGAATITNLQNHQDLAPNFAGTLYGIANAFGSCMGLISPLITGHFTKNGNTFDNWIPVFFIGAAAYIVSAVVFVFLGTGNTQSWNYEDGDGAKDSGNEMKSTTSK